jgi:transcriptional regulator NrdR family protein
MTCLFATGPQSMVLGNLRYKPVGLAIVEVSQNLVLSCESKTGPDGKFCLTLLRRHDACAAVRFALVKQRTKLPEKFSQDSYE